MSGGKKEHVEDMSQDTTINTIETKDKRYTAKTPPDGSNEVEFYRTRKGRKLTGRTLERFREFWKAYGYAKGKAEAADVWLQLDPSDELMEAILYGARREAAERKDLLRRGGTPKYAQGWLSGRRWEDYEEQRSCDECDNRVRGYCRKNGPCDQFQPSMQG